MRVYNLIEIDMASGEVLREESFDYEGPVAMLSGGGGGGSTAGTIGYPTFVENAWKDYWGFVGTDPDNPAVTMVDAVSAALTTNSGNPYENELSYDPDSAFTATANSPLDKMQDAQDAYNTAVVALDEITDWDAIIANAVAEVDADFTEGDATIDTKIASIVTTAFSNADSLITNAISSATTIMASSTITDEIDAYEADRLPEHLRGIGRVAASFADINSVESATFVFALANQESRFLHEINQFGIKIKRDVLGSTVQAYVTGWVEKVKVHAQAYIRNKLNFDGNRASLVNQAAGQMVGMLAENTRQLNQTTAMQIEVSRMTIAALKEQTDRQMELDLGEARWDLEMLALGANMFGQLAGGVGGTQPPAISPVQSAIGGTLSGAATGAAVGSVVPGIGTAAGAIIGGVAGLLGSIL